MSRNPFESDGSPKLLRSVFVLMDILGYSGMIQEAKRNGTQQELLHKLHSVLSDGRRLLRDEDETLNQLTRKDLYALKAFTDNVVIAWPIFDDAEMGLGLAFSKISQFQFIMAISGFLFAAPSRSGTLI